MTIALPCFGIAIELTGNAGKSPATSKTAATMPNWSQQWTPLNCSSWLTPVRVWTLPVQPMSTESKPPLRLVGTNWAENRRLPPPSSRL